jgi:hypothetical protein
VSFVADIARAETSGLGTAGARGARWQQGSVTVNVEASVDELGRDAFESIVVASSAWQNAPGMLPTIVVQRGPDDPIGYRRSGKNKNTVRYAADGDPLANGALAITVITFDAHAKQILDADIVLNGEHAFAFYDHDMRDEGMTTYDLQNVLTHELGHLLGLGEDFADEDATMYAFSQPGEIGKRDLEVVDKDSIADLYSEEFNPATQGGCGGATIAGYGGDAWMWAALGLGGFGLMMRRRSTRGAALAATALGALVLGLGASGPAEEAQAFMGASDTVPMTVTGSESKWEGDMIVTSLSLRPAASGDAAQEVTVRTLGGQVGDLVQVVGHVLPPQVGDSLRIKVGTGTKGETIWVAPMPSRID